MGFARLPTLELQLRELLELALFFRFYDCKGIRACAPVGGLSELPKLEDVVPTCTILRRCYSEVGLPLILGV